MLHGCGHCGHCAWMVGVVFSDLQRRPALQRVEKTAGGYAMVDVVFFLCFIGCY